MLESFTNFSNVPFPYVLREQPQKRLFVLRFLPIVPSILITQRIATAAYLFDQ